MDLAKLTPAPWSFYSDADFVCAGGEWGAGNLVEHWAKDAASPECWEEIKADAEFIALARNAFDVQMRRGWWAVSVPTVSGWFLWLPGGANEKLRNWAGVNRFPDPFTALVGADLWYRENVEKSRSVT
jgi:hypothetical protein